MSSKKLAESVSSGSNFRLEGEIAATEREIGELVYELYGTMGEERRIIEGA